LLADAIGSIYMERCPISFGNAFSTYLFFFVYEYENAHYRYYKALGVSFDIFCLCLYSGKKAMRYVLDFKNG
jgi:hypothetical protein